MQGEANRLAIFCSRSAWSVIANLEYLRRLPQQTLGQNRRTPSERGLLAAKMNPRGDLGRTWHPGQPVVWADTGNLRLIRCVMASTGGRGGGKKREGGRKPTQCYMSKDTVDKEKSGQLCTNTPPASAGTMGFQGEESLASIDRKLTLSLQCFRSCSSQDLG